MEPFMIVSFFTKDTPYKNEVKPFKACCDKFSLKYHIYEAESLGKWVLNAGYKTVIIQDAFVKFPEHNIVYLDIDARVRQYPKLFDTLDCDIGVHYKDNVELLSGTIFFKNSIDVRVFVNKWVAKQEENWEWDQKILQELLKETDLKIYNLPPNYVQIFDLMSKFGQPVIEHLQASRKYQGVINAT